MIGGPSPISSALGSIYNANNRSLAESMAKLASGKRVVTASDDFSGFRRASELTVDISIYQTVKQNLTDIQGLASYAAQIGSDIAEDLSRMKELAALYDAESSLPSPDPSVLSSYQSEFTALKTSVDNLVDTGYYEGIKVVNSGTLKSVTVGPEASPVAEFEISFAAGDIVDTSGMLITDESTVQDQIEAVAGYLYKAQGYTESIQRHIELTDLVIANKEATRSVIMDVDQVKELTRIAELQVRQQATTAMMAQANMVRSFSSRLYTSGNDT